jgi:hypothetical protein
MGVRDDYFCQWRGRQQKNRLIHRSLLNEKGTNRCSRVNRVGLPVRLMLERQR